MKQLDKGSNQIGLKVEFKEGERGPLSSNKANVRAPSLYYKTTIRTDGLNKAFDLLFEEVIQNSRIPPWKIQN